MWHCIKGVALDRVQWDEAVPDSTNTRFFCYYFIGLSLAERHANPFVSLLVGIGRKIAHHLEDGKHYSDKEETLNFR